MFYDERALLRDNPDHSEKEDRFVILGMNYSAKLLVVCHGTEIQTQSFESYQQKKQRQQKTDSVMNLKEIEA